MSLKRTCFYLRAISASSALQRWLGLGTRGTKTRVQIRKLPIQTTNWGSTEPNIRKHTPKQEHRNARGTPRVRGSSVSASHKPPPSPAGGPCGRGRASPESRDPATGFAPEWMGVRPSSNFYSNGLPARNNKFVGSLAFRTGRRAKRGEQSAYQDGHFS